MWINKWWANIVGWLSAVWTIIYGAMLIGETNKNDDGDLWVWAGWYVDRSTAIAFGVEMIVAEIIGQWMYYWFRKGANRYSQHLEKIRQEDASFNDGFREISFC